MMQKNRKILMVMMISTSAFCSCTTSTPKPALESGWAHLDAVKGLHCELWPIREVEMDVAYMTADATQTGGFVAGLRLRNGSRMPIFANTGGSPNLAPDHMTPVPVGRDAYVIAPITFGQESLVIVTQNKNERAWLEIRAVKDNRLVARMAAPLQQEATSGRLVATANGWWLQINHDDRESSYVHVSVQGESNWVFNTSNFQSHTMNASMVGNPTISSAFIVENSRAASGSAATFSVTRLEPNGSFKSWGKGSVPVKGGLESWSSVLLDKKIVLAIIHGDSMVGQGVLTISAIDADSQNFAMSWTKTFPYEDVHLGEPVWLSNGSRALIGIIKWIDSESVLGRVKVTGSTAEQLPDLGVFERGTILAAGYLGSNDLGIGAFRFREKDLWKYKLCKLSL